MSDSDIRTAKRPGVKRSQSASRTLAAFELIATHQPIGVTALAQMLGADKSATQRDIMTLADSGWIRPVPGARTQWELAPHMLAMPRLPSSIAALRQRCRPTLEALQRETDETVYLMVPDVRRFIVVDALESHHVRRMAPLIGMVAPVAASATGRAFLACLDAQAQAEWLGAAPDGAQAKAIAETQARGYAVSDEEMVAGSVTLAAAILGHHHEPVAIVVLTGTTQRLGAERRATIGAAVARTAHHLSAHVARMAEAALAF
jgi:IclR family acetate operon transcriptional repressor